jgi:hypothetical protein
MVAGEIGRQFSLLLEGPAGPDGAFQNDARRRHGRCDNVGVLALLRDALVKKIAIRAPSFQSRLHRSRRYRQVEKA